MYTHVCDLNPCCMGATDNRVALLRQKAFKKYWEKTCSTIRNFARCTLGFRIYTSERLLLVQSEGGWVGKALPKGSCDHWYLF